MRTLIFGAGRRGEKLFKSLSKNDDYNIIGFVDNNSALKGQTFYDLPIYSPDQIMSGEMIFDIIYIAVKDEEAIHAIKTQLENSGISKDKIIIHRIIITPNAGDFWNNFYDKAEASAISNIRHNIIPVIDEYGIDITKSLDFPSGRGRIADALKKHYGDRMETIAVCDSNANAIEYCKKRLMGVNAEFYVNQLHDTTTFPLPMESESFTFIYSWDSMVHFSYKWLDFYFSEFERLLKPGGYLFVHHSNFGAADVYTNQPKSENWDQNPHGRTSISADDIKFIAGHYGFKIIEQKIINWVIEKLDCISIAIKI
jgi:ubiquinone/menaquinone biosynthesis C-methylase UbiE